MKRNIRQYSTLMCLNAFYETTMLNNVPLTAFSLTDVFFPPISTIQVLRRLFSGTSRHARNWHKPQELLMDPMVRLFKIILVPHLQVILSCIFVNIITNVRRDVLPLNYFL